MTGQNVLDEDFLAPTLVAMFTRDVVPFLFGTDRGATLEMAWEESWRRSVGGDDRFARSLANLWPPDRPWPALLLNGTIVETGSRIVATNLDVDRSTEMPEVIDARAVIGSDFRVSTAANMSARFPFIGPAAAVSTSERAETAKHAARERTCEQLKAEEERLARQKLKGEFRVVDGGYFENFGATTALELLREIKLVIECTQADTRVFPVVIQISSDPQLANASEVVNVEPLSFLPQVRSPLNASFQTRNAHGDLARIALARYVENELNGKYLHLRMCPSSNGSQVRSRTSADPPLGWALSNDSRCDIRGYLGDPSAFGIKECQDLRNTAVVECNSRAIETLLEIFTSNELKHGGPTRMKGIATRLDSPKFEPTYHN